MRPAARARLNEMRRGSAARHAHFYHAHFYPRLTAELRDARALLRPWKDTRPVQELDAQLHAFGLN